MIDQKNIEAIREALEQSSRLLPMMNDYPAALAALSRIEAETKKATVKENLTIPEAGELAGTLFALFSDRAVSEAIHRIEADRAAIRADERKRCRERAEIQFEIYEHTYDCEVAVLSAILAPDETPAGEEKQEAASEEDWRGKFIEERQRANDYLEEITVLRTRLAGVSGDLSTFDLQESIINGKESEIAALCAQLAERTRGGDYWKRWVAQLCERIEEQWPTGGDASADAARARSALDGKEKQE